MPLLVFVVFFSLVLPELTVYSMDTVYPVRAEQSGYYQMMRLTPLWEALHEKGLKPGEGTVIAILDTGLAQTQTVLNDNRWCNEAELAGEEGIDDDGNGYVDDIYGLNIANSYAYLSDSDGHGTQIAGIIGMQAGENGTGIAPGARIMPIKISQDRNFDEKSIVEGIHYAVDNGADVINMSFASFREYDSIKEAIYEASKSCVIVAAAGNEEYVTKGDITFSGISQKDAYPASWDCCIGVMSYNSAGELASFSNWDQSLTAPRKYDLVAPGEMVLTVTKQDRFVNVSGTSFSTAYVSGAVAILKQIMGPGCKGEELKETFLSLMDQSITYRQQDHEFSFPKLSFTNYLPLIETMDARYSVSGNDAGTGSVSNNDTGNAPMNDPDTKTRNGQSSQNTAVTDLGLEKQPGVNCQSQQTIADSVDRASESDSDQKSGASQETATEKKPQIRSVKKTKNKITVTLKNLPKTGRLKLVLRQKYKTKSGKTKYKSYTLKANGKTLVIPKSRLKRFTKGKKIQILLKWKNKQTDTRKVKYD